jgi:cystathionine beta-lyase/cystathionine gamma-synthase
VAEGADIVLESLTKYLNGHSDVTGGMAAGSTELMGKIQKMRSLLGGSLSPFDAWLVLRGLRTFPLRMEKHSENAHYLAKNLQKHPAVTKVYYPGLETHKSYGVARKILQGGFGGMLSFELEGGEKAVSSLVKSLEKVEFLPSLAAPSTTISHPAKTSHRSMPQKEREKVGITEGLLRLSAGIERPKAVWEDLKRALDRI